MSSSNVTPAYRVLSPTPENVPDMRTTHELEQELRELKAEYENQARILEYEKKKRAILEHYLYEDISSDETLNRVVDIDTSLHSFSADYTLYYKDIVENQIDLICRFLPDGTLTFANPAFVSFFGMPLEEILGQKYQSLILPEDRANLDAYLLFLSQNYPVGEIEHRVVNHSEAERKILWLQWRSRALFSADGDIREFQAVGRDITLQKNSNLAQQSRFNYLRKTYSSQASALRKATSQLAQAQQEQKLVEERLDLYKQAVESSSDMVLALDCYGSILFANRAFTTAYQAHKKSVTGRYFAELLPVEQREQWLNAYEEGLTGVDVRVEVQSGEKVFELVLSPISSNGRGVEQIVVFARDITMRKYTETAFQQSNNELRHMILELGTMNRISHIIASEPLIMALPEVARRIHNLFDFYTTAIALYDKDEQCFEMLADVRTESIGPSLSGRRIKLSALQISPAYLSYKSTFLTLSEWSANPLSKSLRKMLSPKISSIIFIPLLVRQEIIGYIVTTVPEMIKQLPNEISSLETIAQQLSIYIDNARLLKQEQTQRQQLQLQNDELDAFARMVAHDLKSPLHTIIGFADMLVQYKHEFNETQQHEMLDRVRVGAKHMNKIIDELLLLAQIGRLQVPIASVDMASLALQAANNLSESTHEYEGEILFPESWPVIESYGPWIQEVWSNYISNGIKYGGRPYRLELGSTDLMNGVVRFWVKDNGAGIEDKHLDKLFVEFERLPKTRTLPGTGLGLAIVKRIVEALGGSVGVDSRLDIGSVFYFDLPKRPTQTKKA